MCAIRSLFRLWPVAAILMLGFAPNGQATDDSSRMIVATDELELVLDADARLQLVNDGGAYLILGYQGDTLVSIVDEWGLDGQKRLGCLAQYEAERARKSGETEVEDIWAATLQKLAGMRKSDGEPNEPAYPNRETHIREIEAAD